jgi:hypothetical protein
MLILAHRRVPRWHRPDLIHESLQTDQVLSRSTYNACQMIGFSRRIDSGSKVIRFRIPARPNR